MHHSCEIGFLLRALWFWPVTADAGTGVGCGEWAAEADRCRAGSGWTTSAIQRALRGQSSDRRTDWRLPATTTSRRRPNGSPTQQVTTDRQTSSIYLFVVHGMVISKLPDRCWNSNGQKWEVKYRLWCHGCLHAGRFGWCIVLCSGSRSFFVIAKAKGWLIFPILPYSYLNSNDGVH